jgi:two-component system response regulator FlrC
MRVLMHHDWPGNVRELENAVHRASILATSDSIEPEHFHLSLGDGPVRPSPIEAPRIDVAEPAATVAAAPSRMKDLERQHILETLSAVGGSRKLAVQRLGISERTLRYKLQQYRKLT